jgi:hypothetical protein
MSGTSQSHGTSIDQDDEAELFVALLTASSFHSALYCSADVPTDNVIMNCKLDCFGMNPTFASNPESARYAAMLTGHWTLHLYGHLWRRTAK